MFNKWKDQLCYSLSQTSSVLIATLQIISTVIQYMTDQLCELCADRPCRYKCPQCSVRYCSSHCYKLHKKTTDSQSECEIIRQALLSVKQPQSSIGIADPNCQIAPKRQTHERRDPCEEQEVSECSQPALNNSKEEPIIKTNYIEDESLRLSEQQLRSISSDRKVIEMLGNSQLRDKLLEIDDSRKRLHMLHNALLDENFSQFADCILDVVGKKIGE